MEADDILLSLPQAVTKLGGIRDELEKPPFIDEVLHDLRAKQSSMRKSNTSYRSSRSLRSSASQRPRQQVSSSAGTAKKDDGAANGRGGPTQASDSSMRMRSHGLKHALNPSRPATAAPLGRSSSIRK